VIGAQPQGQTPFIPFPAAAFLQHLSHFSRGRSLRSFGIRAMTSSTRWRWNSDGRLLAGTGPIAARCWLLMPPAFSPQLAKAGSAQITGIARNSAGKLFLCTANPGKVFSVAPNTNLKAPTSRALLTHNSFRSGDAWDWWSPPPAVAEKTGAKSSSRSDAPRLEFLYALATPRIRATNGALVRPVCETWHQRRVPPGPLHPMESRDSRWTVWRRCQLGSASLTFPAT